MAGNDLTSSMARLGRRGPSPATSYGSHCTMRVTMRYNRISADCHIGVETLMWGSDYPHPDGVWSESSKYIEEQFGHLPPDVVRKITCDNAREFYGLG